MKKTIKILALLLALCMILATLVACVEPTPDEPTTHVCGHVCSQCGKCTDVNCTDPVCSEKCQCTGHKCSHVCPLCVKCTDPDCTDAACASKCQGHEDFVDYAGQLKLDLTSDTKKIIGAQVRMSGRNVIGYIDGDTTHFECDTSINEDGVLKARYLAVNTPESTGKIEQYGKKASNFTKETLKNAESIVIESDDDNWNVDSTGSRYLVWIWYRNSATEDYRCLNLELLQRGLAVASNTANNRYGEICMQALNQAKAMKFNCHSGIKDPDYYDGDAIPVTLKELRVNLDTNDRSVYEGKMVSVEGVVAYNAGQSVYIESYDAETGLYIGMSVYYGFGAAGGLLQILSIGNKVRVVGSMQYYEAGGTYQISGLSYSARKKGANYCALISTGNESSFQEISPEEFSTGTRSVNYIDANGEEQIKTMKVCELIMSSSISMKSLYVSSAYTTETGDSKGAMTFTCKDDTNNYSISVRTDVLYNANNELVLQSEFNHHNIDVKGVVDCYSGKYQIKVFAYNSLTINR